MGGMIPGRRSASMVFPEPGDPVTKNVVPPGGGDPSMALLAVACPFHVSKIQRRVDWRHGRTVGGHDMDHWALHDSLYDITEAR